MKKPIVLIMTAALLGLIGIVLWKKPPGNKMAQPYNLIFITIDTLRADHTPFGGYSRKTMPATAEFFQEGINLTQAETVMSLTNPAYASLMTGLYPYHHGVTKMHRELNGANKTLSEILRDHGYSTAAFVSSFVLIGRLSGVNQGFDLYDDDIHERVSTRDNYERRAAQTVSSVVSWLKKRPHDQKFFLFIHLIDPHGPYDPPKPYDQSFHSSQSNRISGGVIPPYQKMPYPNDQYVYIDHYDGEILYLDQSLKALYKELEPLEENSWILFAADHGESQGERKIYFNHGDNCYEPETHIPMVWLPPSPLRSKYPSRTVRDAVSIVDVLPTALDALGFQSPVGLDGESLLPSFHGKPLNHAYRFISSSTEQKDFFAVRSGNLKVVLRTGARPVVRMFDLAKDPQELTDLMKASTEVPALANSALQDYRQKAQNYRTPFQVKVFPADIEYPGEARLQYMERRQSLSPEDREKFKALGYVH
jgi:arylsulfatase A-like enzyme